MAKLCLIATVMVIFAALSSVKGVDGKTSFESFNRIVQMNNRIVKQLKFSWQDCGSSSYPVRVSSVSVSPDPMHLPGDVNIGFSGSLSANLTAPIKFEVQIKKKVVFWITVPCIDNIGSCTYNDGCKILAQLKCPPIFSKYGLPCYCPLTHGTYKLPASPFYIDDSSIPSFLSSGEYQVTIKASKDGKDIACVFLQLSIA